MDIKGFATGIRSESEEISVRLYAGKHSIPYKKFSNPLDVPFGWIPVGTVDWVIAVTGWNIGTEDNYPSWLSKHFHRKIWKTNTWPLHEKVFIKPADKYKRFNGKITSGTYRGKERGPYWCSEIMKFTNEWRYYIAYGKILAGAWYLGNHEDEDAPDISILNIDWPKNWVGSVDFGMTDKGMTLVEAHEPFAVGNYLGLNSSIYPEWIISGWEFLLKKYGIPKKIKNITQYFSLIK